MNRAMLSTVCLIMILTVQTWAQGQSSAVISDTKSTSRFSAEWRMRLSGFDIHDEQSQSKAVDFRTELKSKYLLTNSLMLDIQPALRLQSGQTQSLDGADKPESKVTLNQAAAHYLPLSYFKLSAGALNQGALHSSLLVDSIAFPAARLEASLKGDDFKTGLTIESAIPTSTSLSTNTKELEPTPSLNTVQFKVAYKKPAFLSAKASAGYFVFNNLPSSVAQRSRLRGNDIIKLSEAQYAFSNEFAGIESTIEVSFPIAKFLDLSFSAEYLENQKGPAELSKASALVTEATIHLNQNKDLLLTGGYFSIAPESAVSYFTPQGFETNRLGYFAALAVRFNKEGFTLSVKQKESETMYINSYQSREKTLLINLETFYANL